jgi:hypothetical protein
VLLLLLCGTSWLSLRQQPESRLEAYRKTLIAKGEKLTWAEVLPPPTPPESNGLSEVQMAFSLLGKESSNAPLPYAMLMVAPGRAMIGHRQPEALGYDFTNSWVDFTADRATNRPALVWLQAACQRPRLVFPLDYSHLGLETVITNLPFSKRAAQELCAATWCDLHNDNLASATTNLVVMLEFVQKNEAEGILLSHQVRRVLANMAVAPTWELLQTADVTDSQLAPVQARWELLNFFRDNEFAYDIERVWYINEIQKARVSHAEFVELYGLLFSMRSSGAASSGWSWPPYWEQITEGSRNNTAEMLWRTAASYADELRVLQSAQIVLETLRQMQTNQSRFYKADYDLMLARLSKLPPATSGKLATVMKTLRIPNCVGMLFGREVPMQILKTLRMEAARDLTVTAIALKRYELKHGQLPEKLDQLVPEFLPAVPIDCFSGKPLHYQLQTTGAYLLYSVGEDGHDDGGDPTSTDPSSHSFSWLSPKVRDLVWPQPATQTEIDAYFAHPPK